MSATLSSLFVFEAAIECAGNWKRFDSFAWFRNTELEKPQDWTIVYTHHRESGLLDQSNASVIRKDLLPFAECDDPDVVFESHSHWAVGHIDGFSLRVFRDGEITDAFRVYHRLVEQMDNYSILDENDYSERELDATYENIPIAVGSLKHEYKLPVDWIDQTYGWLSEYRSGALENTSDQGAWPDEEDFLAAFFALGYERLVD